MKKWYFSRRWCFWFLQKLERKLGLNGFGMYDFFLCEKVKTECCFVFAPKKFTTTCWWSSLWRYLSREENGRREDSLTFWLIPTSILWEDFSSNKPNDDSDKMFPLNFEQNFFVTKFPTLSHRRKKFHLPSRTYLTVLS